MPRKLTTEEFIEKAKKKHGNKYDYSKVEYISARKKVSIICIEHGEFKQTPDNHLRGKGCPTCSGNIKLTTEKFIEKAHVKHGNKYDYSNVEYINAKTKVIIRCIEHGEFKQTPSSHLNGNGCPTCANILNYKKQSLTTEGFIEKAKKKHGNKYDYSNVKYINNHTKVIIRCIEHGEFKQTPGSHLSGCGCPTCGYILSAKKQSLTTEKFIEKAKKKHGNKYDYSKVKYIDAHKKVIIRCIEHGEFKQKPGKHLYGNGCPTCANILNAKKQSLTTEGFIEKAKKKHGDKYDYSKVEYISARKKVSIICIEHGEFKQTPNSHLSGCGCPTCANILNAKKQSLTTEGFIEKAKKKHGNKYDYSNVKYINNHTKVIIRCIEHGEFKQTPNNHLRDQGCPTCSNILNAKKRSLTTKEFIEKAKEKHCNKYNYSKVKYINNHTKVIIRCIEHGEFKQTPGNHLYGYGCPTCANILSARKQSLTTEGFIEKAKKKHGNKYDYSKVEYINNHTKVIIRCIKHGEFKQTPGSHLSGHGCPTCSGKIKLTTKGFIEKAKEKHGNKYDYSNVEYINAHKKVIIRCVEHGEFKQQPGKHLSGRGCPTCANILTAKKLSLTTEEFIEKAKKKHGNKYDYSKVEYINNHTKVIIRCIEHGEFKQRPSCHLSSSGCPICVNKTEAKVYDYLKKKYNNYNIIHQFKPNWCKNIDTERNLPFDICIEELKLIIEIDGEQHFTCDSIYYKNDEDKKDFQQRRKIDLYKMEQAKKNGYHIIRLYQPNVWHDVINWKQHINDTINKIKKYDQNNTLLECFSQNKNIYNWIFKH